jgi:hypothetical protein
MPYDRKTISGGRYGLSQSTCVHIVWFSANQTKASIAAPSAYESSWSLISCRLEYCGSVIIHRVLVSRSELRDVGGKNLFAADTDKRAHAFREELQIAQLFDHVRDVARLARFAGHAAAYVPQLGLLGVRLSMMSSPGLLGFRTMSA